MSDEIEGRLVALVLGAALLGFSLLLPGLCAVFFTHAAFSAPFPQAMTLRFRGPGRAFQTIEDVMHDPALLWGINSAAAGGVLITLAVWAVIHRRRTRGR